MTPSRSARKSAPAKPCQTHREPAQRHDAIAGNGPASSRRLVTGTTSPGDGTSVSSRDASAPTGNNTERDGPDSGRRKCSDRNGRPICRGQSRATADPAGTEAHRLAGERTGSSAARLARPPRQFRPSLANAKSSSLIAVGYFNKPSFNVADGRKLRQFRMQRSPTKTNRGQGPMPTCRSHCERF